MGKLFKRYDYQPSGASKVETTEEGYLKVYARAAKVGVLKYRQLDGTIVRELVPAETVFDKDSMATIALKPVTNNHPSTLLDSETTSLYQVGFTGESVKKSDEFLEVVAVITDKKTIGDVERGKVEVSPGYVCELDFTPGKFDGEEYDAIQRNRRYNHLAIVNKGRSGPEVRLRLDADDAVQVELNQPKEIKRMKLNLGGKEYECADDVGAAFQAEMEKCKTDSKKMDELEAKLVEAGKEKDQLLAKADGLASEIEKQKKVRTDSAPADLRKAVKDRIALEKVASAIGVEKFDDLSDIELKKSVIKMDSPETNLDGKSDEYINARFDVAAEAITASDVKAKKIGEEINAGNRTEKLDAEDSRQKMIARQQNAWKGKGE